MMYLTPSNIYYYLAPLSLNAASSDALAASNPESFPLTKAIYLVSTSILLYVSLI